MRRAAGRIPASHALRKLRGYLDSAAAGTLINELRKIAQRVGKLPKVKRSRDAADDYLLALAQSADADYLVTGDKSGLLTLKRHAGTRIVTARQFSRMLAPKAGRRSRSAGPTSPSTPPARR